MVGEGKAGSPRLATSQEGVGLGVISNLNVGDSMGLGERWENVLDPRQEVCPKSVDDL